MGKIPKAVVMSIRPEWCERIGNGKKTVELRKSFISNQIWYERSSDFTVYIYCTKGGPYLINDDITGRQYTLATGYSHKNTNDLFDIYNGKIIGQFSCDSFDHIVYDRSKDELWFAVSGIWKNPKHDIPSGYCLTEKDIKEYLNDNGYGWHIDKLKLYEEPKELGEFGLKRPPQSWCYLY